MSSLQFPSGGPPPASTPPASTPSGGRPGQNHPGGMRSGGMHPGMRGGPMGPGGMHPGMRGSPMGPGGMHPGMHGGPQGNSHQNMMMGPGAGGMRYPPQGMKGPPYQPAPQQRSMHSQQRNSSDFPQGTRSSGGHEQQRDSSGFPQGTRSSGGHEQQPRKNDESRGPMGAGAPGTLGFTFRLLTQMPEMKTQEMVESPGFVHVDNSDLKKATILKVTSHSADQVLTFPIVRSVQQGDVIRLVYHDKPSTYHEFEVQRVEPSEELVLTTFQVQYMRGSPQVKLNSDQPTVVYWSFHRDPSPLDLPAQDYPQPASVPEPSFEIRVVDATPEGHDVKSDSWVLRNTPIDDVLLYELTGNFRIPAGLEQMVWKLDFSTDQAVPVAGSDSTMSPIRGNLDGDTLTLKIFNPPEGDSVGSFRCSWVTH